MLFFNSVIGITLNYDTKSIRGKLAMEIYTCNYEVIKEILTALCQGGGVSLDGWLG